MHICFVGLQLVASAERQQSVRKSASEAVAMYDNRYKKTSSFPSILMQYGPPCVAKQVHWSHRIKEKEQRKRMRQSRDDLDSPGTVVEKKGKAEMRTLRLETIAREQLARYDSYIQRLHDKVARQRTEMRRRAEETETRILAREQQRRRERNARKTQPLPPINNPEHFKKYPKTKFGKTVLLEDDMKRKGLLRCQEEVDQLWHSNTCCPDAPGRYLVGPNTCNCLWGDVSTSSNQFYHTNMSIKFVIAIIRSCFIIFVRNPTDLTRYHVHTSMSLT
ncbi:uncharacterized protein LOC124112112 isoform X1 [Haliotis rufescens]|uniref:uncharacterized protein LOC124112112 isoform X1 n=2 Tax=Haliotis rufescens TaxID=6454 RepID=UPI001EAFE5E1|nr:uncharacterized protein LOC124112112 isoform X1 [Haliotis rufescens]XP_046328038.1 uncharacterized protein LOC124112112 isoform X1 [Haliotis rufescens]XP_048242967.1 uncharacterized protein LOC124112112 isoform X1 [Haliotis rufescens]